MAGYASLRDLKTWGLPAPALEPIATSDQMKALESTARFMDSFFRKRFSVPFLVFGDDVKMCNAQLSAWELLRVRGFNPDRPADVVVRMSYEDCRNWLRDVAVGKADPDVTDATPTVDEGAPVVEQDEERGWNFGEGVSSELEDDWG